MPDAPTQSRLREQAIRAKMEAGLTRDQAIQVLSLQTATQAPLPPRRKKTPKHH